MGNEWSCPCGGDRVKETRRLPSSELNPEYEKFPMLSIDISAVHGAKLQRRVNRPYGEFIISSLSKHPALEKCLVISQHEPDLQYSLAIEGNYQVFNHNFASPEFLAFEIQKQCEKGFCFIGGYWDRKNFLLVYYENREKRQRDVLVKMESGYDISDLKTVFVEEKEKMFLGSIFYKGSTLVIFEEMETTRELMYFVAEFPFSRCEKTDFEQDLADTIHKCTVNKEVIFRACVSSDSSLFLIFIQ